MGIKSIVTDITGQIGLIPKTIYIDTDDTIATVVTAGYLNEAVAQGFNFDEANMALVTTKTTPNAASTQVSWLEISKSGSDWSLVPAAGAGEVVLPTVINYLAHFTNTTGTLSSAAANVINAGNIQAGLSGTAGTLSSFPATALRGSLILAGVNNTGNTNVTISNAAHGQASVYSIPDGGQATAEFIISDSAGTQSITTGSLAITLGNFTVAAGNIAATLGSVAAGTTVTGGTGVIATTGDVTSAAGNVVATAGGIVSGDVDGGVPGGIVMWANTTASGNLSLFATDNAAGNFDTAITNAASIGQDQILTIPDAGAATGTFMLSSLATPSAGSNLISFNVTVDQAALAAGGLVALITAAGAGAQYKILELFLNSGGTNFAGGGGDRLGQITDGTTVYTVIPAAQMQALVNARWGSTEVPFPAAAAINTSSVAGENIRFAYSGGTTDYTAGSLVMTGLVERVA